MLNKNIIKNNNKTHCYIIIEEDSLVTVLLILTNLINKSAFKTMFFYKITKNIYYKNIKLKTQKLKIIGRLF